VEMPEFGYNRFQVAVTRCQERRRRRYKMLAICNAVKARNIDDENKV
jgi:hypothetical protein